MTKGEAGIWEKEPGNLKRDIKVSWGTINGSTWLEYRMHERLEVEVRGCVLD